MGTKSRNWQRAPRFVSGFAAIALAGAVLVVAAASPASAAPTTTVQQVPGTTVLQGVSCPTAASCVAVGFNVGEFGTHGVVVPIVNGVAGAAQPVPDTGTLAAVACTSATFCVAVGNAIFGGPIQGVVVPITNGVPGPRQIVPDTTLLIDVACTSTTFCVAVGNQAPDRGVVLPIADGVAGVAQLVPGLNTVGLTSIACSNATTCVASGNSVTISGGELIFQAHLVLITNGMAGTLEAAPGISEFFDIACPTTLCQAVGVSDSSETVVVPIADGTLGTPQIDPGSNTLYAISCASGTACQAVGANDTGVVVPVVNGVPGATHAVAGTTGLSDVACPSATTCHAVGTTGVPPDDVGVVVTITQGVDETSLICTPATSGSGAPIDICTVSDPNGIRTVQVYNSATDQKQTALAFDCTSAPTSVEVRVPAGTRYKVAVTDCNSPRVRTSFVIRPNASVNQVSPAQTSGDSGRMAGTAQTQLAAVHR